MIDVKINDISLWDYCFIKGVEIPPPKTKLVTVEVPGRDGILDLTEQLIGRPLYENRPITITAVIKGNALLRIKRISQLSNMFLGKKVELSISNMGGFFIGRFSIDSIRENNDHTEVTLNIDCEPYIYDMEGFGDRWKWDTFSFVDGVIRPEGNTFDVDGAKTLIISSRTETTPLKVTTNESGMSIRYKGKTFELFKGENVLNKIRLEAQRDNRVTIMGKGRVKIEFRGRRL